MTTQLITKDGHLFIGDSLLLAMYPAGDCDTVPWPRDPNSGYWTEELWNEAMNISLYDAREMGDLDDDHSVILPDGTIYNF
jgi:hypothetical protein